MKLLLVFYLFGGGGEGGGFEVFCFFFIVEKVQKQSFKIWYDLYSPYFKASTALLLKTAHIKYENI